MTEATAPLATTSSATHMRCGTHRGTTDVRRATHVWGTTDRAARRAAHLRVGCHRRPARPREIGLRHVWRHIVWRQIRAGHGAGREARANMGAGAWLHAAKAMWAGLVPDRDRSARSALMLRKTARPLPMPSAADHTLSRRNTNVGSPGETRMRARAICHDRRMLMPVAVPISVAVIPGTADIIAVPIAGQHERHDRNVISIVRQIDVAMAIEISEPGGGDPAALTRIAHIAPRAATDAAMNVDAGAGRNAIDGWKAEPGSGAQRG